jgi:hypothetical protein
MATIEETQHLVEGLTRFVVIPSESNFYFCGDDSNLDTSKNVAIWVDPIKVALHFTKSKDPYRVWYWEHTLCEVSK